MDLPLILATALGPNLILPQNANLCVETLQVSQFCHTFLISGKQINSCSKH